MQNGVIQSAIDKTLEELDGQNWGEPTFDSYVVINCHRLRRVPLGQFTLEDVRLLIGQGMALAYLLPLALQELRNDPLLETIFFPGDLLAAVLRQSADYWLVNSAQYAEVQRIIDAIADIPDEIEQAAKRFQQLKIA